MTTNVEECGPFPIFASFTLAFALQLRKKHGKTSARVRKTQSINENKFCIFSMHFFLKIKDPLVK